MKESNIIGKINSIETTGLVDGPGIRFVVFMQGCPMRCLYCHNPETWEVSGPSIEYTVDELVDKILRYKPYFKNNGGVTFSGGEPLMQQDFLIELLKRLKEEGIHTCIDTAGSLPVKEELFEYLDLALLDIKAVDSSEFEMLTNYPNKNFLNFLDLCQKHNTKLWLRQVIVPTINDDKKHIELLNNFIKDIKNVEKVELLPYHTLGIEKYHKLKIKYPLEGIPDLSQDKLEELKSFLKY